MVTSEAPLRRPIAVCATALLLALLCWCAFPGWADGWDGLGFLASVAHFDLTSFSPHPPGYPVYVALLKLVALTGVRPLGAARVVGVGSGLATFFALRSTLEATTTPPPPPVYAALGAAAVCVTPLVFQTFSGVGSEGPALAFAALAALGALDERRSVRTRSLVVGLSVGLGLGVRLSWAPFYLPFVLLLPRGVRLRALVVGCLACVLWAVPLVVVTGAPQLASLALTHLHGHMAVWGGTALTEPTRLPYLLHDVFIDGLACDGSALGIATTGLLCLSASLVVGARVPRCIPTILGLLPYLVWITFGQNLKDQPRHVVPIVALIAFGLVRGMLAAMSARRWLLAVGGLLVALLAARTAIEAQRRLTLPPVGAQLLAYLRAHASEASPGETVVFAGESGRFLDGTEWQPAVHPAATMGDALLAFSRLSAIPAHVFLTGELRDLPKGAPVSIFCGPPRIAGRLPCLNLYVGDGITFPTR